MNKVKEIVDAMDALGYPREKHISFEIEDPGIGRSWGDFDRARIKYGNMDMGVYDFVRHTFVD